VVSGMTVNRSQPYFKQY